MRYPVGRGSKADFDEYWKIDTVFGKKTLYGYHEGIDINLKTGANTDLGESINAISGGKLEYYHNNSHPNRNFGKHNVYKIEGPWGTRWVHQTHCEWILTEVQELSEGTRIGKVGKSGTILAHLHFSIFKVDPSSLPQGIDTIAKTLTQLNSWWEDPMAFIERWRGTGISNVNMQEELKYFGVKTFEELRQVWDKEQAFLVSEREKTARLIKDLAEQKKLTQAQTEALKASQGQFTDFLQLLVEKFSPSPVEYEGVELSKIIELEIDKAIARESDLVKANSLLEKEIIKIQDDKKIEVDTLRGEIDRLVKHADNLSKRLEDVENDDIELPPEETEPGLIDKIISFMAKLLRGKA